MRNGLAQIDYALRLRMSDDKRRQRRGSRILNRMAKEKRSVWKTTTIPHKA